MSQQPNYASIVPGMPVFDAMGVALGPVEAIDATTLRVQGQDVPVTQIARVEATGIHLHLASTAASAQTATVATAEDHLRIPLVEERLTVGTREVDLGEIIIRKRVLEEERMVPVIFRREEVEVIRREPGQQWSPETALGDGVEVTRIPINAWEPVVGKEAFISREVVVDKRRIAEEQQITETVRRQQVSIEQRYADARPELERHFLAGQSSQGGASGTQAFADAESHYRTGFAVGSDPHQRDQDFAATEPTIREKYDAAEQGGDAWAQLRDKIQAGFEAARRRT